MTFEKHEIEITALSPILIGDGEKGRAGFDYVCEGNIAYRVDFDKYCEEKLDTQKAEQLSRILLTNRDFSLTNYLHGEDFSPYILYQVDNATKRPLSNRYVVHFFIKVKNKPYIPGSSLKGALRKDVDAEENYPDEVNGRNIWQDLRVIDSDPINTKSLYLGRIHIIDKKKRMEYVGAKVYGEMLSPGTKIRTTLYLKEGGSFSIKRLKMLSIIHSGKIIDEEMEYYSNAGLLKTKYVSIPLPQLYTFYKNLERDSWITRIGFGSGISSSFKDYFDMRKRKELANTKYYKRKKQKRETDFSSRRIVQYNNKWYPMGWIRIDEI